MERNLRQYTVSEEFGEVIQNLLDKGFEAPLISVPSPSTGPWTSVASNKSAIRPISTRVSSPSTRLLTCTPCLSTYSSSIQKATQPGSSSKAQASCKVIH